MSISLYPPGRRPYSSVRTIGTMSASLPWESRDGSISIIACSWSAPWVLGPAVSGDVPVASGMYDSDEVAGETT